MPLLDSSRLSRRHPDAERCHQGIGAVHRFPRYFRAGRNVQAGTVVPTVLQGVFLEVVLVLPYTEVRNFRETSCRPPASRAKAK